MHVECKLMLFEGCCDPGGGISTVAVVVATFVALMLNMVEKEQAGWQL